MITTTSVKAKMIFFTKIPVQLNPA